MKGYLSSMMSTMRAALVLMRNHRHPFHTPGGRLPACALWVATLMPATAAAGGLIGYEVGTADMGLASAGNAARAQDASTVFSNPAGMTRIEGSQYVISGLGLWANSEFDRGAGAEAALGGEDGGRLLGNDGFFPGGGAFLSHSVSPRLKFGMALAGNFGAPMDYDDDWVGRYYVQDTTLLGVSVLPSVAYRVDDQLSLGASLNAMYGIYENKVAINNVLSGFGDGRLKLDDETWGYGVNLGVLYEFDARTRLGVTWRSEVELDFETRAKFSNLAPGLNTLLASRGLLDADLDVDITVPQQVMLSLFSQVNKDWAVLVSAGWQEWSEFSQIQVGIGNTANPTSLTTDLDFKDTWHAAIGAQYRVSDPWLLSFGIAYDSEFQDGNAVSPLLPVNDAWRFGVGAEQTLGRTSRWGFGAEYLYGGTLDTNIQSQAPVALGGRGDLVGSFEDTATFFLNAYYSASF